MKKLYSLFLSALFVLPAAYASGTDYTRGLSIWFDTPNNLDGRANWYGGRQGCWACQTR